MVLEAVYGANLSLASFKLTITRIPCLKITMMTQSDLAKLWLMVTLPGYESNSDMRKIH